ncbi:MAG: metallopeptidase TldD-related protein [Candidatus Cloacimonetes bacterium]|nr:metallopeptidase TldD-related protein [Candidatus Cloacimonadota bacterium]
MKDRLYEAGEFIRKHSKADDFTLFIRGNDTLQTRFAQNAITQHISGNNITAYLSVAFGDKRGSANINQLDNDSLLYLIKTAENIAKINQPDPEFVPSESDSQYTCTKLFSKETAKLDSAKLVDNVQKSVENAQKADAKLSGITEREISQVYVNTKNGFEGYFDNTYFSHSMTMKKGDVETKVSQSMKDYSQFNLNHLIDDLNSQFNALTTPELFEAQKIPVILRPAALLDFFEVLYWTFNRRDADEGTSPYSGNIGKKFFGDRFSFSSTLKDDDIFASPFGHDGIVNKETEWVEKGELRNMPVERGYARRNNLQPSSIFNFNIQGGDNTEEEMLKMTKRGLIINRFWYIRPVDYKKGEFTGLTRDGVLYFEDGKVKHSVNNLRWNEVLHDATRRILALGKAVLVDSNSKVPFMLIDDFNFVDKTSF